MNKCRQLTISGLLMTIGTVIYILFREPVIFISIVIRDFKEFPLIPLPDNILTDILRYQLPDMLWCCAVLVYASVIDNRLLRLIAVAMPAWMEFGQLVGFIPGTFDIVDLIIYIIMTLIFLQKWKRKNSKRFATA